MPVGKKWMVVVSVMATGMTAALFFRKDASQVIPSQPSQVDYLFRERVERRVAADSARASAPAGPIATSRPRRPPAWRVTPAQPASISDGASKAGDVQPTFHKSLNPVGALLPPVESVIDEEARDLPPDEPAAEPFAAAALDGTSRHQIRDGDTLTRLAQEYLGAADRYLEIFDLNRDILSTPDLLPIGMMLRIPSREAKTGEEPSRLEPELPIVPIQPAPLENDAADPTSDESPNDKSAMLESAAAL